MTFPFTTRPLVTGYPSTMGDDVQLNTTTLILHAARTHPEREIVYRTPEGGWDRYTYAAAYERVIRGANALRALGVEPGDRVGVLDWNSRRHYELYWAIPGLAAVLVQLNLRLADLLDVGTPGRVVGWGAELAGWATAGAPAKPPQST